MPAQGDAADVAFSFSDSGAVTLTYDAAAAKYLKTAYGAPQVDESTGAQLAFDNVLVLFTDIKLKNPDDPNNLVTDFAMSSGTGYYCYGGKFRAVTWEKGNPEDPLRLKDENGAALQVNVGKSYVAIVGKDREGTLLFGGVSPTGVIGGEGASSDAQSGAAASAEPGAVRCTGDKNKSGRLFYQPSAFACCRRVPYSGLPTYAVKSMLLPSGSRNPMARYPHG